MTSLVDMAPVNQVAKEPVVSAMLPQKSARFGESLFMKVKSKTGQIAFVRKDSIQHVEFVPEQDNNKVKISLIGGQWLTYDINVFTDVSW